MMAGRIEVQDVFRKYGSEYLAVHGLPPHIQKAVRAINNCRTSVLGGHKDSCNECDYTKISYNSCRNRHCPKCQALAKERWLMARQEELLPVPYFHVVYTLPSELDEIVLQNQVLMYNLLFKASQETIRELASDKKYLGARIGLTSILHTWGQNLTFHPHVHYDKLGIMTREAKLSANTGNSAHFPLHNVSVQVSLTNLSNLCHLSNLSISYHFLESMMGSH